MRESIFKELVDKYFAQVVGKVTEESEADEKQPFLHKKMLMKEYSPDLSWAASSINNSVAAADVVALDSSLPLKQRPSLQRAAGKLPKIGLKFRKSESDISNINVMIARGANEAVVAAKVLDDTARAIRAIDIRNEIMFLQALSSGQVLITGDDTHQGVGIRADFGYREENKSKAKKQWGTAGATPLSDIAAVFDAAEADGNAIMHAWMDNKTFNALRNSDEGKVLAAAFAGQVITDKTMLPTPTRSNMLSALKDEFNGAEFHVITSRYVTEAVDGTKTKASPWVEGNVVFTTTDRVGRLVYGTLAEESNPVGGVVYQKAGDVALISKYSETDPLEEFTAGQALCMPVIDGSSSIYLLTQK